MTEIRDNFPITVNISLDLSIKKSSGRLVLKFQYQFYSGYFWLSSSRFGVASDLGMGQVGARICVR